MKQVFRTPAAVKPGAPWIGVRGEKPEADFQDLRHQVVEVSNVDTT